MDRIGKIFGRKSAQTAPLEGGRPGGAVAGGESEPAEFYGLKLILDTGKEYAVASLPVSIGRSAGNQIILEDETISSKHALIYYDELAQEVCILDQDSLNGMTLDRFSTRRNILYDGVQIGLGAVNLTYRDTGYIHNRQASR